MAVDLTAERVAANQSRFREANEHIELAADRVPLVAPVPFLCECPREDCTTIVPIPLDDYEAIRQHPRLFLTAPGHDGLSVESTTGSASREGSGLSSTTRTGTSSSRRPARRERSPRRPTAGCSSKRRRTHA